jgi:hypothetical protein
LKFDDFKHNIDKYVFPLLTQQTVAQFLNISAQDLKLITLNCPAAVRIQRKLEVYVRTVKGGASMSYFN